MTSTLEQTYQETDEVAESVTITQPVFDGRSYNWQHEEKISAIFNGEYAPATPEEAETLLQEQFGSVYRALPEDLLRDRRLLLIATVQSAGHQLKHAPADMREQLDAGFFVEALRLGARGWIMQWASDAVRNDPAAAIAAVKSDGAAITYLAEEMQNDETIQRAALENTPAVAAHIEYPASDAISMLIDSIRSNTEQNLS